MANMADQLHHLPISCAALLSAERFDMRLLPESQSSKAIQRMFACHHHFCQFFRRRDVYIQEVHSQKSQPQELDLAFAGPPHV